MSVSTFLYIFIFFSRFDPYIKSWGFAKVSSPCILMLDRVLLIDDMSIFYIVIYTAGFSDACVCCCWFQFKLVMDGKSFDLSCLSGKEDENLNLSPFLQKLFREVCSFDAPALRHISFAF